MNIEQLKSQIRLALWNGNIKDATEMIKQGIRLVMRTDDNFDKADLSQMQAEARIGTGDLPSARKSLDQAIKWIKKSERNDRVLELGLRCADTCLGMAETQKAKDLLLKFVLAEDTSRYSLFCLERVGLCFLGEGEPTKALVYFRELAIRSQIARNREEQVYGIKLQARVYADLGDFVAALRLLELACRIAMRHDLGSSWGDCMCELSHVYSQAGFHDRALVLLANALGTISKSGIAAEHRAVSSYQIVKAWSTGDYEVLLHDFTHQVDWARKAGYSKPLIKALQFKAAAFNGLARYTEAQETVWDLLDTIDGNYVQNWLATESGLTELAVALEGQNKTELSAKTRKLSQEAFQIRVDRSIPFAKKATQLEQLGKRMSEIIEYLRLERVPVIRYMGRVIRLTDGHLSINGIDSKQELTATERNILNVLWINRGKYFSDDHLISTIYEGGENMEDNKRKAAMHIVNIRKKLQDTNKKFIETKSGEGYRIAPE